MKHTRELAYLRQLCCLGLPKEILMLEFLREITKLIPSHNNIFTGLDLKKFVPADYIMAIDDVGMIQNIQHILFEYWIPERQYKIAKWFQKYPVATNFEVCDAKFKKSEFFNLVLTPLDQYHPSMALITAPGKPIGTISLFRPRTQKPFSNNEQLTLLQLIPYISHALQNEKANNFQYSDTGAKGMMVMNPNGDVLFQCSTSQQLLMLANYPLISKETSLEENLLLPKLAKMCRNLNALFENKDAPPPSFSHTNGCGRFIFTAHWLKPQNREPGGLIGVTIEHQEPQVLKILRGLRDLPLSPTQKEVAHMLAQGHSTEDICQRLHIKRTTFNDHLGKIFIKLDINSRQELLPLLLAKSENVVIYH